MEAHVNKMLIASQQEVPSSYTTHRELLDRLECMVLDNKEEIVAAVDEDFGGRGKPYCTLGDIFAGLNTLREVNKNAAARPLTCLF